MTDDLSALGTRDDCVFCDPQLQSAWILRSPNFLVVYNIAPILPGHCLVIPRWHVRSLFELPDRALLELMQVGRDVARLVTEAFGVGAFNWTIQEGEEAGQSIGHLHLHVIPRRPGDLPAPGDWYPRMVESEDAIIDSASRQRLDPAELARVSAHLREAARRAGLPHSG